MKESVIFIISLLSMLLAEEWYEMKPQSPGYSFMNMETGGKWSAMGGVCIGVKGDVFSIFHNPGTVMGLDVPQIGLSISQHTASTQTSKFSFVLPYYHFLFGFNLQALMSEEFEYRTTENPDSLISLFNFYSISPGILITYHNSLFALGINQSMGFSTFNGEMRMGTITKAGFLINYKVLNFGTNIDLINFSVSQEDISTGMALNFDKMVLVLNIKNFSDYFITSGMEYRITPVIYLRGGIRKDRVTTLRAITGGFSIFARGIEINYSAVYDFITGFNNSLSFTYNLKVGERERREIEELARRKTLKEIKEEEKRISEEYYRRSIEELKNKNFKEAMKLLDYAILLQPANRTFVEKREEVEKLYKEFRVNDILKYAKEKMEKGDYLSALVELKNAEKIDPSNKIIDSLINEVREKQLLNIANLPHQENIQNLYEEGLEFYSMKEYRKAIEKWDSILVMVPENIFVQQQIRLAEKKLKEEQKERKEEIKDMIRKGHIKRAEKYLKKYYEILEEDDVRELRRTLRITKQKIITKYLRAGEKSIEKGDYIGARLNFSKVLSLDPNNREAREKIESLKKMTAKEIESLNLKAILAYTEGNLELAIKLWEEVLKMDPQNESALKNIKRARNKLKMRG